MTSAKGWLPMDARFVWTKNVGYKVPVILSSVLLLAIVWGCPPPSLLSYSSLSESQFQKFFSRSASNGYRPPANISSNSTPVRGPTVRTDLPGAGKDSEPKKQPHETVAPDRRQSASPVNGTTINPIDVTSEEEDTELVEELAVYLQDAQIQPAEEKYIIPLLSDDLGTGNLVYEYKSAATVARALNRTLCLVPFRRGPSRHSGGLANRNSGLAWEDRYDPEVLSKYVNVISLDECVRKCERRLDEHWQLRHRRSNYPRGDSWFNDTPRVSYDFNTKFNKWGSTADVAAALAARNDAKCVGLGGLWPGLQWRGVLYAASVYMQHSKKIMQAADLIQKRALGSNDPNYVSVHWRFEESNCRGYPLGLCFTRCGDGAVIATGRPSETWKNMTLYTNKTGGMSRVFVSREDLSGAIYDRAVKLGMHKVYLSTDGWLRGPKSSGIVKWVVEDLRNKSLDVVGLWMIEDLPNFADGFHVYSAGMADLFGNLFGFDGQVSSHIVALVEQELCERSSVFVGSGQSSWSSAIATTRKARRWKQEFAQNFSKVNLGTPSEVVEQAVIDKILTIQYPTYEDDAPDSWLDYDSCEDRLLRGLGECKKISHRIRGL